MPTRHPQVLAGVTLLAFATSTSTFAQPPDFAQPPEKATVPTRNPMNRGGAPEEELPLLPLSLDEWQRQNGGATRLRLKMDNASALEIAEEVEAQTGLGIALEPGLLSDGRGAREGEEGPNLTPRFSVEAKGEGFWKDIANWGRGENRLSLGRDLHSQGRWTLKRGANLNFGIAGLEAEAGPIRMLARSITTSRTRSRTLRPRAGAQNPENPEAAAPTQRASLTIQTYFWLDPRLEPSARAVLAEVSEARDDKGRVVAPLARGYNLPQSLRDGGYATLSLEAPQEDAKSLTSIKGVVRVSVVAQSEKWEADLKAPLPIEKNFATEDGEVSIKLESLAKEGSQWNASFRIIRKAVGPRHVFKPRGAPKYYYSPGSEYELVSRSARFVDADGVALISSMAGASSRGREANGLQTSTMRFSLYRARNVRGEANPFGANAANTAAEPNQGEPVKMILEVPTQMREVEVPFSFANVPLP